MRHLVFLILTAYVATVNCKDSVPVLIWNNQKVNADLPNVSALQVVPFISFLEKYLKSYFPLQNVLLFLQDELSIEDLSSHEKELSYLADLFETSNSLYLPSVKDASYLEHSLPAHGCRKITLEAGSPISSINLKKDENNCVVVKLPSTRNNPSRTLAMQKTDEVIQNVISKVGQMADFTFVYTGIEPSLDFDFDELEHRRTSRSLSQANVTQEVPRDLHKSECVLLYLRSSITVFRGGTKSYELNEDNSAGNDVGDCVDNIATIKLRYKNVGTLSKVTIEFRFKKNSRRWWLIDIELYEQREDSLTATVYPKRQTDRVPLGKSYTCAQKIELSTNANQTTPYKVIVDGLQVEAFTNKDAVKFHDAWDCVGFFTIPIWMGILSGILLTLITLFGFYMLSDVKTMDRFDDPKGKHFMVAAPTE